MSETRDTLAKPLRELAWNGSPLPIHTRAASVANAILAAIDAKVEARLAAMEAAGVNRKSQCVGESGLDTPSPSEPSPAPRGPSEPKWPSDDAVQTLARRLLASERDFDYGWNEIHPSARAARMRAARGHLEPVYAVDVPAIERAAAERGRTEGVRAFAEHLATMTKQERELSSALLLEIAERFLADRGGAA